MSTALSQLRAHQAMQAAGCEEPALERASSVNNEVWLGKRAVVRLNGSHSSRLRREAFLARHLPSNLRYPKVLHYGGEVGADYLVQQRYEGKPLARIWPMMSDASRRSAISQLGTQLRILHRIATPDGLPPADSPQLLEATGTPTAALSAALDKSAKLTHVDKVLVAEVQTFIASNLSAIVPFDSSTLVHGDLTFENLLWDGRDLTILDYEFAHGAPPDVDLDVLLRCCALPFLHVAPEIEHLANPKDYSQVPRWLNDSYPELFDAPRCGDRLMIYSLAFDVRELLMFPPAARAADLSPHHPLNRMRATLDGNSYIARFAAAVSRR